MNEELLKIPKTIEDWQARADYWRLESVDWQNIVSDISYRVIADKKLIAEQAAEIHELRKELDKKKRRIGDFQGMVIALIIVCGVLALVVSYG